MNSKMYKDITYIKMLIPIRYKDKEEELFDFFNFLKIEDSEYNHIEIIFDYRTGKITNYSNFDFELFLKICDEGIYFILNKDFDVIREKRDCYIPDCIPNEYGDYVNLIIENGVIKNITSNYDFSCFYEED